MFRTEIRRSRHPRLTKPFRLTLGMLLLIHFMLCTGVLLGLWGLDQEALAPPFSSKLSFSAFVIRWLFLFALGLPLIALYLQRQTEHERLSGTDEKTGLYNYRHLVGELDRELQRARRYGQKLTTMMIDIDDFKRLNDTFGHVVGDRVLNEVAFLLTDSLRGTDIAGRYGGDEFFVILPHSGSEEAQSVAHRFRTNLRQYYLRDPMESLPVSVSIGIFSFDNLEYVNQATLIDKADQAMLFAKHTGKDKVLLG